MTRKIYHSQRRIPWEGNLIKTLHLTRKTRKSSENPCRIFTTGNTAASAWCINSIPGF